MSVKLKTSGRAMLGSGAIVAAGIMVEMGSQFARTFVLAHMLDPREFGLVASVNTLYAFIVMSTAIGMDRYLVYSVDGGERRALNAAHVLSVARGIILSVVVLLLAVPTANLMKEPGEAASFALMAFVPFLGGFMHLGLMQRQREGVFWPTVIPDGVGAVLGLAAAITAAMITPNHHAILWGLGVQIGSVVATSYILAARGACESYGLSFERKSMGEALRFCVPFAANGLAVAISAQLDRLIVGAWLGVIALGMYSLILTLLLQPLMILLRLVGTVIQPSLSAAWHADPRGAFHRLARHSAVISCLIGQICTIGTFCLGSFGWNLMFSGRYAIDDKTFILLGFLVLLRASRSALNLIGLAIGSTAELMVANLAGCFGLLVTCAMLYVYPILASAVVGLLVAEVLSLAMLSIRLDAPLRMPDRPVLRELAIVAIVPALIAPWILIMDPGLGLRFAVAGATTCLSLARGARLYLKYT